MVLTNLESCSNLFIIFLVKLGWGKFKSIFVPAKALSIVAVTVIVNDTIEVTCYTMSQDIKSLVIVALSIIPQSIKPFSAVAINSKTYNILLNNLINYSIPLLHSFSIDYQF